MTACPHCGKPKATPRDYVKRRNKVSTMDVCWAEVRDRDAWLTPDEEVADAETLRRLLAETRRRGHELLCDAASPINRRRDWK